MAQSRSILLASGSPRRRALLEAAGFDVEVRSPDVDEAWPGGDPGAAAIALARRKLDAVTSARTAPLALAADTVVVLDDEPLGKPASAAEAAAMLGRLSARPHQVITGFVVSTPDQTHDAAVRTEVRFRALTGSEIDRYVASGEPFDKAGAYGIQGLGGALIDTVHGSYTNVVGLPLAEVLSTIDALAEGRP